jgi:FkbM family methyltransferase
VARALIAGLHNTLGCAAAVGNNDVAAARHFNAAVTLAGIPGDPDIEAHRRAVREMARLDLLAEAASEVEREMHKARRRRGTAADTRMEVLQAEVDFLHYALSLAAQRQQLDPGAQEPAHGGEGAAETELRRKSLAQLGQDLWVLEQTGYKRGGYFVEFGATDGVVLSNTWLLEKEFGWQGLCAEPNPEMFERLRANRGCVVSDACIAGETGKEVEFIFADVYGGFTHYAGSDVHAEKRAAYRRMGRTARLITVSLNDFLERHGAPREIDYLSIDTEGSEHEILAAFPFEKWRIGLLTVEHNFSPQRAPIRALLERHGYRCIERRWDDWYVHRDLPAVSGPD